MGVYGQGTSNNAQKQEEPVMGHPVFPPPVAFTQPLPSHSQMAMALEPGQWSASLCGCCSDCDLCCQTCWCPCVTFGQVAEIVSEGASSCTPQAAVYGALCAVCIPSVYSFQWRRRLRLKFGLEKGCCGDFCVHCCCGWCALCQEHRELRARGMDPSLGWKAVRLSAPGSVGGMVR